MTASPLVGSTFFGLDISQLSTRLLSIRRRISKRVLVLEFGSDVLLLAEATLTQSGVQLNHVSSFTLPPEALDRGVPAEPLKMAGLIQAFCAEKKIPAHRAAVVLPPDLAFQRLLDLPASLTTEEAREYVLNPANGLQIPFPLTQTDFDLFPVSTPTEHQTVGGKRLYMLTAIPEVLVDPIVEMLQAADLELQLLELGSHSQLRNHAADLITLAPQQVDLVLELLPDCSNLMLVSCSGLLGSERLAAIRNLPELELDADQLLVAVGSGLSAEDLVLKDEGYLPLSDLDLRVLVADLRASFERFHLKLPGAEIRRLILTGVNSSHPLLADLLAETLGLPVVLSKSTAVTGLAGLSMGDLLLQSGLGRLIGLSLGLLPSNQLLACSLEGRALNGQESRPQNDAVAIADLLSSSEAQTGLDLMAVEVGSAGPMAEENNEDDPSLSLDPDGEEPVSLESSASLDVELSVDVEHQVEVEDQPDDVLVLSMDDAEPTESSGGLSPEVSVDDESAEIVLDQSSTDASSEDEWPSIVLPHVENSLDLDVDEDEESSEEQWPSISGLSADRAPVEPPTVASDFLVDSPGDDINFISDSDSSEDVVVSESEWPSIASTEDLEQRFDGDLPVVDEASTWPSIASEQNSTDLAVAFENPEPSAESDEVPEQQIDVDHLPAIAPSEQSSLPSVEMIDEKSKEFSIPGLNLSEEVAENQQQANHSDDQGSTVNDSASADVIQELGELRFADDD